MDISLVFLLVIVVGVGWFVFNRVNNPVGPEQLNPESKWMVELRDGSLVTTNYDGDHRSVKFADINQVAIETNDSGPLGTDVWWIIIAGKDQITVPGGATGEDQMLDRLQKLEGFNNEKLIAAMSCVEVERFLLYERNSA